MRHSAKSHPQMMAVAKPSFETEGFGHFPRVLHKNPQSVFKTLSFVLNPSTLSEGFTETLSAEGFEHLAKPLHLTPKPSEGQQPSGFDEGFFRGFFQRVF